MANYGYSWTGSGILTGAISLIYLPTKWENEDSSLGL